MIIKLYEEKKKTRFQRFIERHTGKKNKRGETVEEYLRNLLRNRLRRLILFGHIDKAYIQKEIQRDVRIVNGTVNRYCTVITNNQSQKSMSWTFKGDKINLSFEALIANLQSLDNEGKVFSSKYVHTSHICNLPRRIGVCLEKTHITLESAKVNLSNNKSLFYSQGNSTQTLMLLRAFTTSKYPFSPSITTFLYIASLSTSPQPIAIK